MQYYISVKVLLCQISVTKSNTLIMTMIHSKYLKNEFSEINKKRS